MDYLQNIISSLDESEKREFQYFIQRNKRKDQRKDLELFKLYCTDKKPTSKEQIALLNLPNSNAYHSTRKRLYQHLSEFALIKAVDEDESSASKVSGLLNISRHLFERGLDRIAWNLLFKAEGLAHKNECFAELNAILLLQADKVHLQDKKLMAEVLRQYDDNRLRLEEEERITLLQAELKQRIRQALATGRDVEWVMILRETLSKAPMRRDIAQSPRLLCAMLRTVRETAKHSKQYLTFENLATSLYNGLNNKTNNAVNVEILYMIVHSKYRNKRFDQADHFAEQMRDQLLFCSKTMRNKMEVRTTLLECAVHVFKARLDRAIAGLEHLTSKKLTAQENCNTLLNLSVYHFYSEDFKSAFKVMNQLKHSDKWYQDKMGIEWCLKRKMIELLTLYELGELELFESRMRSADRRFKALLENSKFHKAKAFLSLMKQYNARLHELDPVELETKIELSWEWLPHDQEDLQAMMFYAWLKSKTGNKSCYQTLLDLVGSRGAY